jgi:hypothetical protein
LVGVYGVCGVVLCVCVCVCVCVCSIICVVEWGITPRSVTDFDPMLRWIRGYMSFSSHGWFCDGAV